MSNYKTLNFFNKTLLIFSAPFLPVMDYYLNRQLATAEKRQKLYLKTAGFFPFRVLAGYLLVKKYLKVLKQDRLTPYQGMAGFLYDLKNRMLNQTNKKWAIDSNYKFALGQVSDLIKKQDIKAVIDYGCGPGILTEKLRDTLSSDIKIIGLDVPHETLEANKILRPDIIWDSVSQYEQLAKAYRPEQIILVLNGVVSFMDQQQLLGLLRERLVKHIFFLYYISLNNVDELMARTDYILNKEDDNTIDYNLKKILADSGYGFDYKYHKAQDKDGNLVYGIARANF